MAITLVQNTLGTFDTIGSSSLAFSSNLTAGNLSVVGVTSAIAVPGTVTDNQGNTYSLAKQQSTGDAFSDISSIFYASNVVGGAGTVTVQVDTAHHVSIFLTEWSGVVASSPLDVTNGGTASSSTTISPGAITPNQNNSLIISQGADFSFPGRNQTPTVAGGYTGPINNVNNDGNTAERGYNEYLVQSTAAATTASFTVGTATKCSAVVAVFKPAIASKNILGYRTLLGVGF